MIFRKVTPEEMERALTAVNAKYDGNIIFNRFDIENRAVCATLRVRDSKKAGARRSWSGRRLVSACWHVHGYFFEELFKVNPLAIVSSYGKKITIDGGNWIDWNAGSMAQPVLMSKLCDCE